MAIIRPIINAGLPIAPLPTKIVFIIVIAIKPIEKPPYLLLIKQTNDDEHVKYKKSNGQIVLKKHGITFLSYLE